MPLYTGPSPIGVWRLLTDPYAYQVLILQKKHHFLIAYAKHSGDLPHSRAVFHTVRI